MRPIDADVLEKEGWSLHRTVRVDRDTLEYQIKPIAKVLTIEPERPKGKWIILKYSAMCSNCHRTFVDAYDLENWDNYCRHCGAIMEDMINKEEWDGI